MKSYEDLVENIVLEILNGVKENVFFLLYDSLNVKWRFEGKFLIYLDDCGFW